MLALLRRDHLWAEFWTSSVGVFGWATISYFAPPNARNFSETPIMDYFGPPWAWQLWLAGFAIVHLVALFAEMKRTRVAAAFCLCVATFIIMGGIYVRDPWTSGLSLYLAAVGVYCSAMAHQAASIVTERRTAARDVRSG